MLFVAILKRLFIASVKTKQKLLRYRSSFLFSTCPELSTQSDHLRTD